MSRPIHFILVLYSICFIFVPVASLCPAGGLFDASGNSVSSFINPSTDLLVVLDGTAIKEKWDMILDYANRTLTTVLVEHRDLYPNNTAQGVVAYFESIDFAKMPEPTHDPSVFDEWGRHQTYTGVGPPDLIGVVAQVEHFVQTRPPSKMGRDFAVLMIFDMHIDEVWEEFNDEYVNFVSHLLHSYGARTFVAIAIPSESVTPDRVVRWKRLASQPTNAHFHVFTPIVGNPRNVITYYDGCSYSDVEVVQIAAASPSIPNPITASEIRERLYPKNEHKWAPITGSYLSCVDGREDTPVLGTPGGDGGEFLLGLYAYEKTMGVTLEYAQVQEFLFEWVMSMSPSRKVYWHSDHHAVELIGVGLEMSEEELYFPHPHRTPAEIELFLDQLSTNASYVGCGHIKSMVLSPSSYDIRPELISAFIRSWYVALWNTTTAGRMIFKILDGYHAEEGTVVINTRRGRMNGCAGMVPMVRPRQYNDSAETSHMKSMFIVHPEAQLAFRMEMANAMIYGDIKDASEFNAEYYDNFTQMYEYAYSYGELWTNATLAALSPDTPVFSADIIPVDLTTPVSPPPLRSDKAVVCNDTADAIMVLHASSQAESESLHLAFMDIVNALHVPSFSVPESARDTRIAVALCYNDSSVPILSYSRNMDDIHSFVHSSTFSGTPISLQQCIMEFVLPITGDWVTEDRRPHVSYPLAILSSQSLELLDGMVTQDLITRYRSYGIVVHVAAISGSALFSSSPPEWYAKDVGSLGAFASLTALFRCPLSNCYFWEPGISFKAEAEATEKVVNETLKGWEQFAFGDVEQTHLAAWDERETTPSLSSVGGDMVEFLNALEAYKAIFDVDHSVHNPFGILSDFLDSTYIRDALMSMLNRLSTIRGMYGQTDEGAVQWLQDSIFKLGVNLTDPSRVLAEYQQVVLMTMVKTSGTGSRILKEMLASPVEYQITEDNLINVIDAFFVALWDGNSNNKLWLRTLPGTVEEKPKAEYMLNIDGGCPSSLNFDIEPTAMPKLAGNMMSPSGSGFYAVIYHEDAVHKFRKSLARFFSTFPHAATEEELLNRMNMIADVQKEQLRKQYFIRDDYIFSVKYYDISNPGPPSGSQTDSSSSTVHLFSSSTGPPQGMSVNAISIVLILIFCLMLLCNGMLFLWGAIRFFFVTSLRLYNYGPASRKRSNFSNSISEFTGDMSGGFGGGVEEMMVVSGGDDDAYREMT